MTEQHQGFLLWLLWLSPLPFPASSVVLEWDCDKCRFSPTPSVIFLKASFFPLLKWVLKLIIKNHVMKKLESRSEQNLCELLMGLAPAPPRHFSGQFQGHAFKAAPSSPLGLQAGQHLWFCRSGPQGESVGLSRRVGSLTNLR